MSEITGAVLELRNQLHTAIANIAAFQNNMPKDGWTGADNENEAIAELSRMLAEIRDLYAEVYDTARMLKESGKELAVFRKNLNWEFRSAAKAQRTRKRKELFAAQLEPKTKNIYVIRNDLNDLAYVGQSVNPEKRFMAHKSEASTEGATGSLGHAIRTLGIEHFWYEILEADVENYDEREAYWIKRLGTLYPNGYNKTTGGRHRDTFTMATPRTRKNPDKGAGS